uniref:Uncharacterized protein n=1 Tax=Knipowitschia caucasica TaxID=637954 RepID=A0AAV2MNG6_KNICA
MLPKQQSCTETFDAWLFCYQLRTKLKLEVGPYLQFAVSGLRSPHRFPCKDRVGATASSLATVPSLHCRHSFRTFRPLATENLPCCDSFGVRRDKPERILAADASVCLRHHGDGNSIRLRFPGDGNRKLKPKPERDARVARKGGPEGFENPLQVSHTQAYLLHTEVLPDHTGKQVRLKRQVRHP